MATTVRTLQLFIDGDWVESTGSTSREIVSPVTGEQLADVPDASPEDVDRAARAAREAQPAGPRCRRGTGPRCATRSQT